MPGYPSEADVALASALWMDGSPTLQSRLPQPSIDTWNQIGLLIAQDEFEPIRNEIYENLVNRIGRTVVWQRSIRNRLANLKNGKMTYGDTEQEIISDILEAHTFRIAEDDQFQKWESNVYAAYHKINRMDFYAVTIEDTHIVRAFTQPGGFRSLINSIESQLYSSNDLDEFVLTKRMMVDYATQQNVPLQATQFVEIPDIASETATSADIELAVARMKGKIKAMSFPTRAYNAAGIMSMTEASDFRLFMRSEITILKQITSLTRMFNPQYMDVNIPITDIDSFDATPQTAGGELGPGDDILAIAAHKNVFRIVDVLRRLKRAENARNLYHNWYYHVHQLYAASPFFNCIYFVKDGSDLVPTP